MTSGLDCSSVPPCRCSWPPNALACRNSFGVAVLRTAAALWSAKYQVSKAKRNIAGIWRSDDERGMRSGGSRGIGAARKVRAFARKIARKRCDSDRKRIATPYSCCTPATYIACLLRDFHAAAAIPVRWARDLHATIENVRLGFRLGCGQAAGPREAVLNLKDTRRDKSPGDLSRGGSGVLGMVSLAMGKSRD
jgi:hypothetical protein